MARFDWLLDALHDIGLVMVAVSVIYASVLLFDWLYARAMNRQFPQDEPPDDLTPGAA